ncbi:unnamed protein product [Sympodiomycopsis kandeliae]
MGSAITATAAAGYYTILEWKKKNKGDSHCCYCYCYCYYYYGTRICSLTTNERLMIPGAPTTPLADDDEEEDHQMKGDLDCHSRDARGMILGYDLASW